jgi:hypothetical protein
LWEAILSQPQPRIEPLPPITAKLANPHPSKVVGIDHKKPIRLPQEARDAFALDSSRNGGTYDRASGGGW